ncbi:MAG TPA: excisionase family DNA-binding protein [Pseudonocardiaceae bacterium]|nr:excisionase family DNA-binding protein [Pseudonocardiaceae bacterium]
MTPTPEPQPPATGWTFVGRIDYVTGAETDQLSIQIATAIPDLLAWVDSHTPDTRVPEPAASDQLRQGKNARINNTYGPPASPPPNHKEGSDSNANDGSPAEYTVLTVEQAAKRLKIGRTLMYELVSTGAVESIHIGRLRRIPAQALTKYIAQLGANTTNSEAA